MINESRFLDNIYKVTFNGLVFKTKNVTMQFSRYVLAKTKEIAKEDFFKYLENDSYYIWPVRKETLNVLSIVKTGIVYSDSENL